MLTLKEKNVVKDLEAKNYLDVLVGKFPKEVSGAGLRAYGEVSEVEE